MESPVKADNFLGQVIAERFYIGNLIGSGSFGDVYEGIDKNSGKRVAIKFESHESKHKQLENEYMIYRVVCGGVGIPEVYCFGTTGAHDYLVMELLGPSLETLFNHCERRFTLKTVLMLGLLMVDRIEYVHQMSHLHRDLKPDNFVVSLHSGEPPIYLIDFGLAKRYCEYIDNRVEHIKCQRLHSFTGTARYASINAQQQLTQSRRDDLESLGYMLVYFLKGRLPWQHVPRVGTGTNGITAKQRKERILAIKQSTSASTLCTGLPKEFETFITYCRGLKFDDQPNYAQLRFLLRAPFTRNFFVNDLKFDWKSHEEMHKKTKRYAIKPKGIVP